MRYFHSHALINGERICDFLPDNFLLKLLTSCQENINFCIRALVPNLVNFLEENLHISHLKNKLND